MNKRGHVTNAILLSIGLGFLIEPSITLKTFEMIAKVFVPVVLGALFPDVDTAFGKHRKTLHNIPVLIVIIGYPVYFGNLQYVWIGVLTHYVLDVLGSKRGIALFYPFWDEEFGLPVGVRTSSKWAPIMTVVITAFEIVIAAYIIYLMPAQMQSQAQQVVGL